MACSPAECIKYNKALAAISHHGTSIPNQTRTPLSTAYRSNLKSQSIQILILEFQSLSSGTFAGSIVIGTLKIFILFLPSISNFTVTSDTYLLPIVMDRKVGAFGLGIMASNSGPNPTLSPSFKIRSICSASKRLVLRLRHASPASYGM